MKYRVSMRAMAYLSVTVEAENEEDAIEAAYEEIPSGVCARCSGWNESWSLDIGEWAPTDEAWPAMEGYKAVEVEE